MILFINAEWVLKLSFQGWHSENLQKNTCEVARACHPGTQEADARKLAMNSRSNCSTE